MCKSIFVNLGGGGGGSVNTGVLQIAGGVALDSTLRFVEDQNGTNSILQLSTSEVGITRTINLSAGSSNVNLINTTYTINNSGAQTGTATGIFLNATETALNGMGHNLLDIGTGGSSYVSRLKMSGGSLATLTVGDSSFLKGQINILTDSLVYFLRIGGAVSGNNQTTFIGDGNGAWETQFNGTTTQYWDYQNNVTIGNRTGYGNRLSVVAKAANNAAVFYTSAIGEIMTVGVGGGITSRFNGAIQFDGSTSSFPSIKRSGINLEVRLADDTGYGGITAGRSTEKTLEVLEVSGAMGLGFFNTPAINQPTTAIGEATYVSNGGGAIHIDDTIGGYTMQQVVQALQNLGLLA
jgi:hypothetical protein